MIISYKWLNDYVKSNLTPTEIDDTLTFSGLEIEGVEKVETIKMLDRVVRKMVGL